MNALVQSMVDNMTAMERVANTPIPISYGIHLKQCVTLYLFALPLTLVNDLGWMTIPIVTVVAFTFMGIEGIADEIEMPFGNDPTDLPLDRYCQDLKEEVFYMIERLPESGEGIYGYDDGEGDD
jgi:ion channel-forming bestrophin family protein